MSGPTASSSCGLETTKHSGGREFNPNAGSESGMSNNCSYASWGHAALTLQATGVGEECSHTHSIESPAGSSSPEHQVLANGSGKATDQKSQNSSLLWSNSMWLENGREKCARTLATQQTFTPLQQHSLAPLPEVFLLCLLGAQNSHVKPWQSDGQIPNPQLRQPRGAAEVEGTDIHTRICTTVINNSNTGGHTV